MEARRIVCAGVPGALLIVLVLLLPSAAPAAPSPGASCLAAKMLAAGAEGRAALACAKRSLATGTDFSCLGSAGARRTRAFAGIERRGGCAQVGDFAAVGTEVRALHDALLAILRPGAPAASRCTAAQLAAASRTVAKLAQAYARDDRNPDPARLAAAIAGAYAHLETAFTRAAARGDCLSSAGATDARAALETGMARIRATLAPSCGDDVRTGTELCDGADAAGCPSGCTSECTCNAQCGNGTVEAGEECDGTTCPGELSTKYGCFPAGAASECECCVTTAPCYVRGFGNATPVETACCSGSACNVPGPEAGPDAIGHCSDVPPATCPCFTAATIDSTFAAGYFDADGRGGGTCAATTGFVGVNSADQCTFERLAAPPLIFPRAGFGVDRMFDICSIWTDRDPENSGACFAIVDPVAVTSPEATACVAEVLAATTYQTACP